MEYLQDEQVQQAAKAHSDCRDRLEELEKELNELLSKRSEQQTGRDLIRRKELNDLITLAKDDLNDAKAVHSAAVNQAKNQCIQTKQPGYIKACQDFHGALVKAVQQYDKCESMHQEISDEVGGNYPPLHWVQFKQKLQYWLDANPGAV